MEFKGTAAAWFTRYRYVSLHLDGNFTIISKFNGIAYQGTHNLLQAAWITTGGQFLYP